MYQLLIQWLTCQTLECNSIGKKTRASSDLNENPPKPYCSVWFGVPLSCQPRSEKERKKAWKTARKTKNFEFGEEQKEKQEIRLQLQATLVRNLNLSWPPSETVSLLSPPLSVPYLCAWSIWYPQSDPSGSASHQISLSLTLSSSSANIGLQWEKPKQGLGTRVSSSRTKATWRVLKVQYSMEPLRWALCLFDVEIKFFFEGKRGRSRRGRTPRTQASSRHTGILKKKLASRRSKLFGLKLDSRTRLFLWLNMCH